MQKFIDKANGMMELKKTLHIMKICEANPESMKQVLLIGLETYGWRDFMHYVEVEHDTEFINSILQEETVGA